jgi:hypothetical protein
LVTLIEKPPVDVVSAYLRIVDARAALAVTGVNSTPFDGFDRRIQVGTIGDSVAVATTATFVKVMQIDCRCHWLRQPGLFM